MIIFLPFLALLPTPSSVSVLSLLILTAPRSTNIASHWFLFNSRSSLCTSVGLILQPLNWQTAFSPADFSQQGNEIDTFFPRVPQGHMPGSLGMTPVLLEGQKEYFGLDNLKDAGQRVRAEASSSRISNSSLRWLKVFLPPECCFLPSSVSYRYKPCNPPCQLSIFFQSRSIWQVG